MDSRKCPFCSDDEVETLYHWQCACTRFADARTKVHNDIWSEVFKAICSFVPEGWASYKETTLGHLLDGSRLTDHAARRPDGIFCQTSTMQYVLVDFTRGWGSRPAELLEQEQTKHNTYSTILNDLQRHHSLEFFPLACGYNGALPVRTWKALMDRLGLSSGDQERVLKIAVRAICVGFSTMVDIRHGCISARKQSSH